MNHKQIQIDAIVQMVRLLALIHYDHPDQVAKLYGAMRDVEAEVMREMEKIREVERDGE